MFTVTSLFIGALLDALIGPNLVVPGEPFMLAAGFQLYHGAWAGVMAVLLGGFIGDQLSFFIGYRVGSPVQKKLRSLFPKIRRPLARCRLLMHKKGNYVLAFARLLGPVAWVVPFMAGSNKITWWRFTLFSSIGLLLGVGQFVLWGYLSALGFNALPVADSLQVFIIEHKYTLLALLGFITSIYIGHKMKWKKLTLKSLSILTAALLFSNYSHFFWRADDFKQSETAVAEVSELLALEYKAYPGKSAYFNAQAINIIYKGASPKGMMTELGWLENQTFSRDEIELRDYVKLLQDKTPPVSDLFWQGKPQDMAFQLPGDLMKRNHIRWWYAGIDPVTQENVWLGAVSYDNGLKVTPYSGIITILHQIDPDVDLERDAIATALNQRAVRWATNYSQPITPARLDNQHDYHSDGRILMITDELGAI